MVGLGWSGVAMAITGEAGRKLVSVDTEAARGAQPPSAPERPEPRSPQHFASLPTNKQRRGRASSVQAQADGRPTETCRAVRPAQHQQLKHSRSRRFCASWSRGEFMEWEVNCELRAPCFLSRKRFSADKIQVHEISIMFPDTQSSSRFEVSRLYAGLLDTLRRRLCLI